MKQIAMKLMMAGLAVVLVAGGLIGCSKDINIGYETQPDVGDASNSVRYKVESNDTKFNVDGVSLDLYFGGSGANGEMSPFYPTDGEARFICFALCFYDGQYYLDSLSSYFFYAVSDYHDI